MGKRLAVIIAFSLLIATAVAAPVKKEKTRPAPPSASQEVLKKILSLPPGEGVTFWTTVERIAHLKAKRAKLSPMEIRFNEKLLSERDRKVLRHLINASNYINEIFLRQVYSRNPEIRARLEASRDPLDRELLGYFRICFGPFDPLDDNRNFIDNAPFPKGANFYPEDMTKEEFEKWLADHPEDRKAFMGPYTVIRRKEGKLLAIPYSVEYRSLLEPAAKELRNAASLTDNESLRTFLIKRAEAFLTDDYFDSDVAWMDVKDSVFEVTIGPYEVYQDNLFNYKTAYEAFITVNDPEEGKKLQGYAVHLKDMEGNLPIPEEHKNFRRKFESPIRVVQEIYNAGDARAGIQTSAFNLPNDERVREAKGCKKVMLKNVMEAKFRKSLTPISRRVVHPSQLGYVKFEAYFRDVLFHELSHGLGPGIINKKGARVDVAQELKDLYSPMEELKADILGIWNQTYLMGRGLIPASEKEQMCATYLAGIFRSARFGLDEAHGRGTAVQFNWLMEKGAFNRDARSGRYSVNFAAFDGAMRSLVEKVLMIHALGDYEGAKDLMDKYGHAPAHLRQTIADLKDIPVDIEPVFMVK